MKSDLSYRRQLRSAKLVATRLRIGITHTTGAIRIGIIGDPGISRVDIPACRGRIRGVRNIALVLNKESGYWRGILRGIVGYLHSSDWILHSVPTLGPAQVEVLQRWKPAGVIADVASEEVEARLLQLQVPVVNVSNLVASHLPRVGLDDEAVGELVAKHFLDRGLTNFAYAGRPDVEFSRRQLAGFIARIRATMPEKVVYQRPEFPPMSSAAWTSADQMLGDWLVSIPRPVGLMLHDDEWGMWFTQICRTANLRVPDDVAIVGVNDNALNCDLARPLLSSVAVPLERIGQEAAALLDQLIAGGAAPVEPKLIPPQGLTVRASSDVLAIEDADLLSALRFINDSAHKPIGVDDVLAEVPVSRRVLERKFRELLGRSPLQEIRRAHVERAKRLLVYTDASLQQVADRSGFGTMYHLCRIFKRETGQTAIEFRKQFRLR